MSQPSGRGVQRAGEEGIERFVAKQLELVELECAAEESAAREERQSLTMKQLEQKGVLLSGLLVEERQHGLGGHTLLTLMRNKALGGDASKKGGEVLLPQHSFHSGDIVALHESGGSSGAPKPGGSNGVRGLIYRVHETKITVAVDADSSDEVGGGSQRMFKLANDVTYKRYRKAMHALREYQQGPAERVRSVLFGHTAPHFHALPADAVRERTWKPANTQLNEPQLAAIDFALAASDLAVIHGPPGTGKTTTVVELIVQCVKHGQRVLATAPSNVAVDNLAERLADAGVRIVRVGHPARVLPSVLDSTLDFQVHRADSQMLANDAKSEINTALKKLQMGPPKKGGGASSSSDDWAQWKSERAALRRELGSLRKEVRDRESQAVDEIMAHAKVVLCTNAGAAHCDVRHSGVFDVCVIDEAAMALEVSCWIPILQAGKLVLAGDHCQLAPPILSQQAEQQGLGTTLFDRVLNLYGQDCVRMLTVQYRMNEAISSWSSAAMYEGHLNPAVSVANRTLSQLPGVVHTEETSAALCVVDTGGCEMGETQDEGGSWMNEGEALVVNRYIMRLLDAGVRLADVGILTPYAGQVGILRDLLKEDYPELEIGTVDGFQGREKEAIILSLVRSNARGHVGFLADDRRLNVAVTRARRHVAIICDSETVSKHAFIGALLDHCQQRDVPFLCAHELVDHCEYSAGALVDRTGRSMASGIKHKPKSKSAALSGKSIGKGKKKSTATATSPQVELWKEGETAEQIQERAHIADRIRSFLDTPGAVEPQTFKFEPSLSAFGRKVVHEIAEELGLRHSSVGEGPARHVTITRAPHHETQIQPPRGVLDSIAAGQAKGQVVDAEARGKESMVNHTENEAAGSKLEQEMQAEGTLVEEIAERVDAESLCANLAHPSDLGTSSEGVSAGLARYVAQDQAKMSVSVSFGGKAYEVSVSSHCDVGHLKKDLEPITGVPADSQKLMFKKLLCDTDIVGRVIKPGGKVMLLGKSDAGLIKTPVLHEDQRPAASSALTADAEDAGNVLGRHGELTEMAALNAERVARQDMRDKRHEPAAPPRLPEKNAPVRCSKKKNKSKDSGTGVTAASSRENMQQARVGKQKKQADGECSGVDEDDIDALLASLHMTRGITNCGFPKCEAEGVQMMGSTCAHCRLRFCMKHQLPESHGCGQDARAAARASRDSNAHTNLSKQREAILRHELKSKIASQQGDRSRKSRDDSGPKKK